MLPLMNEIPSAVPIHAPVLTMTNDDNKTISQQYDAD